MSEFLITRAPPDDWRRDTQIVASTRAPLSRAQFVTSEITCNFAHTKDTLFLSRTLSFIVMEITSHFIIHSLCVARRKGGAGTDDIPARKFRGGTRRAARRVNEKLLRCEK